MISSLRDRGRYYRVLAGILLIFNICFFIRQDAYALDRLLYLDSVSVYAGDTVHIRNYIDEQFLNNYYNGDYNAENPEYQLIYQWDESNPDCAVLNEDGSVVTTAAGTVKINVTFTYQSIVKTEVFTIDIHGPEQISLGYGETYVLDAANIYDAGMYIYTSSDESIFSNGDGSITVYGFGNASVFVSADDGRYIEVADVSVNQPAFKNAAEARAVNSEGYNPVINNYLPLEGDTPIVWESKDENIAAIADNMINAKAVGETELTAVITAKTGDVMTISTKITVTDPVIAVTEYVLASDITQDVTVDGICDASIIDWNIGNTSGNPAAYFTKAGKLYMKHAGEAAVNINADGRILTINVTVTDPVYEGNGYIAYKGVTKNLKSKITGTDKNKSTVTYESLNKSVASVTDDGKITAKNIGNAVIQVNADGRKIEVTFEVASVRAYRASKKAISISNTKTQYSQAYRMKKGYYDCSSLVWRVYRNYNVYFGVKSGWAPVAADIGRWCKLNGKVIANKWVSSSKLLPGDLVFYSFTKNGRYKNISHVEMYTGKGMDVSASSSNNAVVHYPYSKSSSIVMIARPTK